MHLFRSKGSKIWYVRAFGRRYTTRCTDRKAAAAVARDIERELANPAESAARSYSLDAALAAYRGAQKEAGRAAGTLDVVRSKSASLVRVLGNGLPLVDVTARVVDRFVTTRLGEGVSRHTVSKELHVLRATLRLARRVGLYPHDPAAVLPTRFAAGYTPREAWLTREQAETLLAHLDPGRAAHVAFVLATGARKSEAERAERVDVDLEAGTVRIRGTKTATAAATIPVPPLTRALLERAVRDAPGGPAGRLFAVWQRGNIGRDIAAACVNAGVPRVSLNDLRRSLATWLVHAGVTPYLVSKILRHKDARMVERVYAKMGVEEIGRLVAQQLGASQSNPVTST